MLLVDVINSFQIGTVKDQRSDERMAWLQMIKDEVGVTLLHNYCHCCICVRLDSVMAYHQLIVQYFLAIDLLTILLVYLCGAIG